MIFYKTSSFGNDFIEIDQDELASAMGAVPLGRRASRKTAVPMGDWREGALSRRTWPGRSATASAAWAPTAWSFTKTGKHCALFQIFNRDGGEAELSGNGMAGLAAVLFQRRLAASPLSLHAAIGSRRVELLGRDGAVFQLAVEIGRPDFANRGFFPFLEGDARTL